MQWNKNATTYSESKTNTPNQKPANFFNSQPFSKDFPSNHHFQPFQYCQNPFQQREPNPDDIPLNPDWSIEILTLVYEIIPHIIASCLFQPIGRIWVKLWIFPKVRGEYKETYLKPPSRSLCCDFSLPLSKLEKHLRHLRQDWVPSRELTYPPDKAYLKMIFLFPRWDMLVP